VERGGEISCFFAPEKVGTVFANMFLYLGGNKLQKMIQF
jgi:hypothetical protein